MYNLNLARCIIKLAKPPNKAHNLWYEVTLGA